MPTELFYSVGTVVCIMVFKAHVPHFQTRRKTWFGYWKDDGFVKTKHRGRMDVGGKWPSVRDRWIESYRNRDDVPGECVKRYVTHEDEWCAEAYMQTDYSKIKVDDFKASALNYLSWALLREEFDILKTIHQP